MYEVWTYRKYSNLVQTILIKTEPFKGHMYFKIIRKKKAFKIWMRSQQKDGIVSKSSLNMQHKPSQIVLHTSRDTYWHSILKGKGSNT